MSFTTEHFLSDEPKHYNGIQITAKQILMTVTHIFVPGAIINAHHKHTLEAFGSVPFDLVCLKSRLKVVPSDANLESLSFATRPSFSIFNPPPGVPGPQPIAETSTANLSSAASDQDGPLLSELIFDTPNTVELESQPNNEPLPPQLSTSATLSHEVDTRSANEGDSILGPRGQPFAAELSMTLSTSSTAFILQQVMGCA